jgi:ribosomal-protein-alanine N-acetyltransferase
MIIRKAKRSDFSRVFEISKETLSSYWEVEEFESEFQKNICLFFIVEEKHEIVAYISPEFEIGQIAVSETYQRKRIASKLISYLIENFDIKKIFLEVSSENKKAQKFYQNLGFQIYLIRPKYYSDNSDALLMSYTLFSSSSPEGESNGSGPSS